MDVALSAGNQSAMSVHAYNHWEAALRGVSDAPGISRCMHAMKYAIIKMSRDWQQAYRACMVFERVKMPYLYSGYFSTSAARPASCQMFGFNNTSVLSYVSMHKIKHATPFILL